MDKQFQEIEKLILEIDMKAANSNSTPKKLSSPVSVISKDLNDQGMNFKQINTKDKMVELLTNIVDKVKESNPDFVESGAFKQSIIAFYTKYK